MYLSYTLYNITLYNKYYFIINMLNLLNKKSNLIVDNKIINFTQNRDDKIGYQEKINRENLKKKNSIQYYPSSNKE